MLTVVNEDGTTRDCSPLDEIVREGARRMLAAALETEVNSHIGELAHERDDNGRRLVVRNGYHQPRKVTTAAGVVGVKAPQVNDKRVDQATGERKRFISAILPPWCHKSPKIAEVLPLLRTKLGGHGRPREGNEFCVLRTWHRRTSTTTAVELGTRGMRPDAEVSPGGCSP